MPFSPPRPYVPVLQQPGVFAAGVTTATQWFDGAGLRTASGTGTAVGRPYLVFAAADWTDYSFGNIQASLSSTAAQTGINYTVGLYPVANTGTTTVIPTLGTVVSGSTVLFTAPGAASELRGNSGDFVLPAADLYMIGCVNSGTVAASSIVMFNALLRMR